MTAKIHTPPQPPTSPGTLILGGGPAGLSAAYVLTTRSADEASSLTVLESGPEVGGLSRSWSFEDHIVDLGPHRFFTKLEVVNELWEEVIGDELLDVDRLTRIFFGGKFFYYPLRPWNAFFGLGPLRTAAAILSFLKVTLIPCPNETTFDGWVTNRFGKVLFQTFFETYTEKLWGLPCDRIGADWAAQRIKGLSLFEAIRNALFGSTGTKTLIDRFRYPQHGTGSVYLRMQELIEKAGGQVHTTHHAQTIHHDGKGRILAVTANADEEPREFPVKNLISTMPLTRLIEGMQPAAPPEVLEACTRLRYRNTVLVYLLVEGKDLFPDNWIYIHSPDVEMGRLTNFRNWSPHLTPKDSTKTALVVEYWCFEEDDLWTRPEEELIAQASRELEVIGLIRASDVSAGKTIRLNRSYPVYEKGYQEHLKVLTDFVRTFSNLQVIGRYGAFKYNNQDHSILMGILAAKNLLGESHDLWSVNSDSEYHEEIRPDS
jgi:protoporphyrinogen oxidase